MVRTSTHIHNTQSRQISQSTSVVNLNELGKRKESYMKGHHVYQTDFIVGAIFDCENELPEQCSP